MIVGLLSMMHLGSCDDTSNFLEQYTSQGPIIYAAKVDSIYCQSGLYRVRVNLFPNYDVNRDHCMLRWNITSD